MIATAGPKRSGSGLGVPVPRSTSWADCAAAAGGVTAATMPNASPNRNDCRIGECPAASGRREPGRSRITRGLRPSLPLRSSFGDDLLHFAHQPGSVVRNAVLDGPFDSAATDLATVPNRGGPSGVEHLQVLERVAVHHDQVREMPNPHSAELVLFAEDRRVVEGRVL